MSQLNLLKDSINNFENKQLKYRQYGAEDTEPSAIFQWMMAHAAKGYQFVVPNDGNGWKLFTDTMDCSDAAKELHDAAVQVINVIQNCPNKDIKEMTSYLKDFCWRCEW